jgi:hypothetical protein
MWGKGAKRGIFWFFLPKMGKKPDKILAIVPHTCYDISVGRTEGRDGEKLCRVWRFARRTSLAVEAVFWRDKDYSSFPFDNGSV